MGTLGYGPLGYGTCGSLGCGNSRLRLSRLWGSTLSMSIPKHSMLSGEPRDCSIDIETDKVVHTGVMFLPELA